MRTQNESVTPTAESPATRRPDDCPVEDWLTFLGHRWISLLLWHLSDAPKRNGELATLLPGISAKVLTDRLSSLVFRGLINKVPLATYPRTVNYELTEQGKQVVVILNQLELWSKAAKPDLTY